MTEKIVNDQPFKQLRGRGDKRYQRFTSAVSYFQLTPSAKQGVAWTLINYPCDHSGKINLSSPNLIDDSNPIALDFSLLPPSRSANLNYLRQICLYVEMSEQAKGWTFDEIAIQKTTKDPYYPHNALVVNGGKTLLLYIYSTTSNEPDEQAQPWDFKFRATYQGQGFISPDPGLSVPFPIPPE